MSDTPLLSVCIPTYNRSQWLAASLKAWGPQVRDANGLVELVVCDNCSTDQTEDVAREMLKTTAFRYYRNDSNLGAIGNQNRLARELAQGEYVWILGDDDIVCENALRTIIETLEANRDLDYFRLNYYTWAPKNPDDVLQVSELKAGDLTPANTDFTMRRIDKTADLIANDIHCFTPLYCSIMRRTSYQDVFVAGAQLPMFSSLSSTVPQAEYIVSHFLAQPTFYIGQPMAMASEGIFWENYAPIYILRWLPELYDLSERHGASRADLDRHRRTILNRSYDKFWGILFDPTVKSRAQFSFWTFAKRNARFPEFWRLLLGVALKSAYQATPAPIRTLWKRVKGAETRQAQPS